jgi:outer membrane immunogenic protein
MKRLVLAVALTLGAGSVALAADLPPPMTPPPRAPATYVPAPIPYYNWSGFYIGGNVGYGFSNSNTFSDSLVPPSTFSSSSNNSFLGGGQVGVNWEFGPGIVIGAEADFDWLPNNNNTITAARPGVGGATATATINSRWLTLADAKLGYAWDRFMIYGKGGGAFVGASNSSGTIGGATGVGISGPSTNSGWNAGVGFEYAFWGTWSVKAEYDYVRLGSATYTVATLPGNAFSGDAITANNRVINIAMVGLNYKFGPWW